MEPDGSVGVALTPSERSRLDGGPRPEGRVGVALPQGDLPRLDGGPRREGGVGTAAPAKPRLEPTTALREVGAYLPEAGKCSGQPEGPFRFVVQRPGEGRPEVVVLCF